jgi:hypothetical protein
VNPVGKGVGRTTPRVGARVVASTAGAAVRQREIDSFIAANDVCYWRFDGAVCE